MVGLSRGCWMTGAIYPSHAALAVLCAYVLVWCECDLTWTGLVSLRAKEGEDRPGRSRGGMATACLRTTGRAGSDYPRLVPTWRSTKRKNLDHQWARTGSWPGRWRRRTSWRRRRRGHGHSRREGASSWRRRRRRCSSGQGRCARPAPRRRPSSHRAMPTGGRRGAWNGDGADPQAGGGGGVRRLLPHQMARTIGFRKTGMDLIRTSES